MQLPARYIHCDRRRGQIQSHQLLLEPLRVVGSDTGLAARLEKSLNAFVKERFNHDQIVARTFILYEQNLIVKTRARSSETALNIRAKGMANPLDACWFQAFQENAVEAAGGLFVFLSHKPMPRRKQDAALFSGKDAGCRAAKAL